MDGWLVALIGAIGGLVSGSVASLVAPWAQWGVDKRRAQRERRTSKIKVWRGEIDKLRKTVEDYRSASDVTDYDPDCEHYPLKEAELKRALDLNTQQWYHSLLEQLDNDKRNKLEVDLRRYAQANNGEPAIALLSRTIEQLDKRWELS
ncbi:MULTISPECIES: hypothetical protein [Rhodococcus]|uniref:hypothetical protein n=1 Tax=Rhodococcus TaxID=1827 RepID=UPI001E3AC10C|nr:hypothetical protein [Rhodococcus pyridinivorans]MCD2116456.1 hypothetical protein [Rhodococcus pyridinivorans]MCZ4625599.1 hypothetical protein [Rhodococcus pyridinivorans]MCZ4646809.1 hypothetical protein [Rhodococcus pyridinivorans]MDJ0482163.1 hypothetical protein [Rhodococcus pyridinivorans]MDV7252637.1 hypothetical protein [Rhodococcus pyridinivorans]